MDPISLIVAALVAGAATGAGEVGASAIKDAYGALKRLISRRLEDRPVGKLALAEHETDPDTWAAPLKKALLEAGVADDEAVIAAAQDLLDRADPAGSAAGKYRVDARGSMGVQIGDGNEQINTFGAPRSP